MKLHALRLAVMGGVAFVGLLGVGTDGALVAPAEAVIGRPATPVSYAGVARRTTVRHASAASATPGAGAPGVGVTPGVGVGAPGVGVAPGPGVAPANTGTPVNRVGVR